MESRMFILGANGLEKLDKKQPLPLYSRVYSYGYAMSEGTYAVITEPDQRGMQKTVKMGKYEPCFGTIDEYSRPLSKKFGIGTYYDDHEPDFRFSETEVLHAIENAKKADQERKNAADAKAKSDKEERENLPKLFPHLTVNPQGDQKTTKQNMIAELKKNFPGVKFSVRCDHYDTYNVSWTNGPTQDEVQNITGKFENHETDITGDFRDYAPSNFNRVFGGFKYVFENRHMEGINELLPKFNELYKGDERPETILYRVARRSSFPVDAFNFDINWNEKTGGLLEDLFTITFETKPEKKQPAKVENTGSVQIIDYSDKAIAVIGDTRPIKDTLKELGGRFNFRLTCGAGWIFPKTKQNDIKLALNL